VNNNCLFRSELRLFDCWRFVAYSPGYRTYRSQVAPPRGVQYFYASPAERQPASAAAVNYKVKKQSFLWHIILAILVLFCFDPLFGLVALILAGTVYTHPAASSLLTANTFHRAMLRIRGTSDAPVSVCPSQVGVLLKPMNESSWFWHVSFLPPVLHCVKRKFGYL